MRAKRRFGREFKFEAVRRVQQSRRASEVAAELRKTLRVSLSSLEKPSGLSHRTHRPEAATNSQPEGGRVAAHWGTDSGEH